MFTRVSQLLSKGFARGASTLFQTDMNGGGIYGYADHKGVTNRKTKQYSGAYKVLVRGGANLRRENSFSRTAGGARSLRACEFVDRAWLSSNNWVNCDHIQLR
jgi:hypothetical protein